MAARHIPVRRGPGKKGRKSMGREAHEHLLEAVYAAAESGSEASLIPNLLDEEKEFLALVDDGDMLTVYQFLKVINA